MRPETFSRRIISSDGQGRLVVKIPDQKGRTIVDIPALSSYNVDAKGNVSEGAGFDFEHVLCGDHEEDIWKCSAEYTCLGTQQQGGYKMLSMESKDGHDCRHYRLEAGTGALHTRQDYWFDTATHLLVRHESIYQKPDFFMRMVSYTDKPLAADDFVVPNQTPVKSSP